MRNLFKLIAAAFLAVAILYPFVSQFYLQEEPLSVLPEKPDFAAIKDVNEKKKAFFDFIRASVVIENNRITDERAQLLEIQKRLNNQKPLTQAQSAYAQKIGKLYNETFPKEGVSQEWMNNILKKVNILPEALVLTQAANESAWGTSRFAVKGNNFFGQWCYTKGCGLVPLQRVEGASHEVAKFDSASESVNAYFMNVNKNNAYKELREIRYKRSQKNESLTNTNAAIALTNGLLRYSERGQDYINDLQSMIRVNKKFWLTES